MKMERKVFTTTTMKNQNNNDILTYSHNSVSEFVDQYILDRKGPFRNVVIGKPKATSVMSVKQLIDAGMCGVYTCGQVYPRLLHTI